MDGITSAYVTISQCSSSKAGCTIVPLLIPMCIDIATGHVLFLVGGHYLLSLWPIVVAHISVWTSGLFPSSQGSEIHGQCHRVSSGVDLSHNFAGPICSVARGYAQQVIVGCRNVCYELFVAVSVCWSWSALWKLVIHYIPFQILSVIPTTYIYSLTGGWFEVVSDSPHDLSVIFPLSNTTGWPWGWFRQAGGGHRGWWWDGWFMRWAPIIVGHQPSGGTDTEPYLIDTDFWSMKQGTTLVNYWPNVVWLMVDNDGRRRMFDERSIKQGWCWIEGLTTSITLLTLLTRC